jgi:hypothetical protein
VGTIKKDIPATTKDQDPHPDQRTTAAPITSEIGLLATSTDHQDPLVKSPARTMIENTETPEITKTTTQEGLEKTFKMGEMLKINKDMTSNQKVQWLTSETNKLKPETTKVDSAGSVMHHLALSLW